MIAGLLDFSFLLEWAPRLLAWWLVCLVATAAVLPLCLKVFRGLADRGAGLATAVGVGLTTLGAWWLGFAWFGGSDAALPVRGLMVVVAALLGAGAWWIGARDRRAYVPAAAALVLGLLHLPHVGVVVWLVMIGLGGASAAVWWGRWEELRRAVERVAVPLVVAQVLFLAGFVLFASFRSYLPEATYEIQHRGAEKFGNLMHLNSAMRASTLPPADAWFAGEPTNYYYGGHLATATLAKASMTPPGVAFTLGLATTVGLTLSVGFSLTLNLLGLFRRAWGGRGPIGIGWGVLGGVGTALFGNVDAWQQWGANGLRYFDFWRSSRAFQAGVPNETNPGTITEFPAFSAILGDLHPHHMALPYSMVVMAAIVALCRGAVRGAAADGRWWARAWAPLVAAGVGMGFVYTVNVWDAVVLAPMVAAGIVISRRGVVDIQLEWRWLAFFCLATVLGVAASFGWNLQYGSVPLPGRGIALVAMPLLATAVAMGLIYRHELKFGPWMAVASIVGLFVVCWAGAASGLRSWSDDAEAAPGAASLAVRDFAVMATAASLAAVIALRPSARNWRGFTSGGFGYLLCGVAALVVAAPFLLTTYTPLTPSPQPVLRSLAPPLIDRALLLDPDGTWDEVWRRLSIKPFDRALRTTLGDYLTHWGLLLAPLLALMLARVGAVAKRWADGRGFAFAMVLLAVFCGVYNAMGFVVGPLALVFVGVTVVLAFNDERRAALWCLLAVAFGWHWFIEALNIDDAMVGGYERYNTPFKILFPLWPIFVAGAVVAVREAALLLGPAEDPPAPSDAWSSLRPIATAAVLGVVVVPWLLAMTGYGGLTRGWLMLLTLATVAMIATALWSMRANPSPLLLLSAVAGWLRRLPALTPAALLLAAGLLYPYAAMRERTGNWGAAPRPGFAQQTPRTLDALAYLSYAELPGGARPGERDAVEWLRVHVPRGELILEAPPTPTQGAYCAVGRFAAASGVPTLLGWSNHQRMWRGWDRAVPTRIARKYARFFAPYELQLGGLVMAFFPERADDPAFRADLYAIAFAAPDRRAAMIEHAFPELPAPRRRELLAEFFKPGVGVMTDNQLVDVLQIHAQRLFETPALDDELKSFLRFHNIRYVVIGSLEKERYDATKLAKFDAWPVAYENDHVTIRRAPDDLFSPSEATP